MNPNVLALAALGYLFLLLTLTRGIRRHERRHRKPAEPATHIALSVTPKE
ncbi:MAG TPA: hypothetical protein VFB54_03580 [Burkholderiales bacterium]|nr:hypothetical protein [Burkholderiales bacterium]